MFIFVIITDQLIEIKKKRFLISTFIIVHVRFYIYFIHIMKKSIDKFYKVFI